MRIIDFTLNTYQKLLEAFNEVEYTFYRPEDYFKLVQGGENIRRPFIMIRHDVDRKPANALAKAKLEHQLGITAAYYFRAVPESWDENIIKQIADMGHEIGYHYEDLVLSDGDVPEALKTFKTNLEKLRELYPVKTACMHGSPLSKWDSKDMWKEHSYKDYGIIGEPYFDIDFHKVFYITDTGRRWDNRKFNVRDKVPSHFDCKFTATSSVIGAVLKGIFPEEAMINTHPERWTNSPLPWLKQLVWQNIKNVIKRFVAGRQ